MARIYVRIDTEVDISFIYVFLRCIFFSSRRGAQRANQESESRSIVCRSAIVGIHRELLLRSRARSVGARKPYPSPSSSADLRKEPVRGRARRVRIRREKKRSELAFVTGREGA